MSFQNFSQWNIFVIDQLHFQPLQIEVIRHYKKGKTYNIKYTTYNHGYCNLYTESAYGEYVEYVSPWMITAGQEKSPHTTLAALEDIAEKLE